MAEVTDDLDIRGLTFEGFRNLIRKLLSEQVGEFDLVTLPEVLDIAEVATVEATVVTCKRTVTFLTDTGRFFEVADRNAYIRVLYALNYGVAKIDLVTGDNINRQLYSTL